MLTRARIRGVIIAAQPEEMAPVLHGLEGQNTPVKNWPHGEAVQVSTDAGNILCITTGIGLVSTAGLLGWVCTVARPEFVISAGSAGGLAADIQVGDVVAGNLYSYTRADATVFGYAPGQVPGHPATYSGDRGLLECVPEGVRRGMILSSDAFVTAANVGETRELFPEAVLTDMESTAAAQICHERGIPFVSIRCASDLCSPDGADVYHIELDRAAELSAQAVVHTAYAWLKKHPASDKRTSAKDAQPVERGQHGMKQKFSEESLKAGLLYVLGLLEHADGEPADVPAEIREAVDEQLHGSDLVLDEVLRAVAGGKKLVDRGDSVSLTAKKYDAERAHISRMFKDGSGRGRLHWPPTSQTVIKRFGGYWNEALRSVGLSTQSGRKRGMLKFTDADYKNAVRAYSAHCAETESSTSYNGYVQWVHETGGKFPSGPSVRQHFGSWSEALAQV